MSSPRKRGNKKWGIIFSGNPKENQKTIVITPIKVRRIWEAAKHD